MPLALSSDPRIAHIRAAALPLLAFFALGLALFYSFLLIKPVYGLIFSFAATLRLRFLGRASRLQGLIGDFEIFCGRPGDFAASLLLSVLIQATRVVRIGLLFLAVGVAMPWETVLWIATLVFFLQTQPVSFAGVGVRESAFAYAFNLYGFGQEAGALVGLLFFAQMAVYAAIGGVLEITDRGNPSATAADG